MSSRHFNPKTCLGMISSTGTYTITSGTGSYSGISGSGTYKLSILFLGAKSMGTCVKGAPVAEHELLQTSGTVSM